MGFNKLFEILMFFNQKVEQVGMMLMLSQHVRMKWGTLFYINGLVALANPEG